MPMPPLVIDLRKTEDARDVVHRAVQSLRVPVIAPQWLH